MTQDIRAKRIDDAVSAGGTGRQKAACASKLILGGKAQQRNERQCSFGEPYTNLRWVLFY